MFILDEEESFPLDLSLVQRTQNIELNKRNSKLKQLVQQEASNYNTMELEGFQLVVYEGNLCPCCPKATYHGMVSSFSQLPRRGEIV